ncbi:MAG: T9SS type A sorting domain-containing protein [Flavobacteriales bacterium]|nr:T9SS type A sorting domain-containing protein [Flavobacteriales bacterium]
MKKFLASLLFLSVIKHFSFAQCTETNQNKILLVGDSWAFFMGVDQTINNIMTKWGHSNYKYFTNLTIAENGAETDDFLTQAKQDEIALQLSQNPDIEVVHLSIGGNDVMGDWHISFTQQQTDSLKHLVSERLLQVIEFIKSARPGIRIVWSGYCYPNFEEVVESVAPFQSSHPFYGTWAGMGFPSFLQLNNLLNEFSDSVAAYAAADPQVDFIPAMGLMQYVYGQNNPLGVAPGGTYAAGSAPLPIGFTDYPSPANSMRDYGITKDCFHLSPGGYRALIEEHTKKFYHKFFMDDLYLLAGNESGSVSSLGNVSSDLKMGVNTGEYYATVLTFDTPQMADTTLEKASLFLRRESLTGNNPIDGTFEVKVKNGAFGASFNLEAEDYAAPGDANGNACRFGSNGGNGHWIRLDLPPSILAHIKPENPTQFVISIPSASNGVVTFSGTSDPELAPVLNLKYGTGQVSISEHQKQDMHLFPNPTSGLISIESEKDVQRVEVKDVNGKTILNAVPVQHRIDISAFPSGIYFITLESEAGKSVHKIIKQ